MFRNLLSLALMVMTAGCYTSSSTGQDIGGDPAADQPADHMTDTPPDTDIAQEAPVECVTPAGIEVEFTLEPSTDPRTNMPCTVLSVVSEAAGERIIQLDCGSSGQYTLSIHASEEYALMLWEGEEVELSYMSESPWWVNRWFQLTGSGSFILAGIDADRLYPPSYDPHLMYAPLTLGTAGSDCPPQTESCYTGTRIGVHAVHWEGVETTVLGGTRGSIIIGDEVASSIYTLLVQTAVSREDFQCTDIPSEWYTLLITLFAGD
jgi:hypothetical protein